MLNTKNNLKKLIVKKGQPLPHFDVLVIGGGINGAGIARDAAGRGLSVLICEKNDWASATSSASTKLIHGGLRYLEHYEFRLVKDALIEREILYKSAGHLVAPLRFVLPHNKTLRPKWMIRAGLFLYDYLGAKHRHDIFEKSHAISLVDHPLENTFKTGFVYSDCRVDDARLVLASVLDAVEKGAVAVARTECLKLSVEEDGLWMAELSHKSPLDTRRKKYKITATSVVNAGGPWVNKLLDTALPQFTQKHDIRLVKGSHIVIPRLYQGDHAYILQNDDERIVFTIPYEEDYTLIGTTDVTIKGKPDNIKISADEIDYLCCAVNRYFETDVSANDVVWDYSGVRPLLEDDSDNARDVTRDYKLDLSYHQDAPILSVYGGKITSFRKLSEQVVDLLSETVFTEKKCPAWTKNAYVFGGDLSGAANFKIFLNTLKREFYWLPEILRTRYARNYGSAVRVLLKNCHRLEDLGKNLGNDIYTVELDYILMHEDVMDIEDLLWRRTKWGLHVDKKTRNNIQKHITKHMEKQTK